MLQFMLGIDLFICNWFIYLLTSLLFSVLLLLPTLTEKCQPVFECDYFVCRTCTRLARQKATWYVTALTVPEMLKYQDSATESPCAYGSSCCWMGWFFIGPAFGCAFGILFTAGTTNLALWGFSNVYPHMPSSSVEGIVPVLCFSITDDAWFWSCLGSFLMFKCQNIFLFLH